MKMKQLLKPMKAFSSGLQESNLMKAISFNINDVFEQAIQYSNQGNFSQALKCYDQIIQHEPDHAISYNNMGILLNRLNQFEQASICFQKAVQCNTNYANAWFNWGNMLKKQEQYQSAIEKYTEAIKCNPQFSGAYNNMGECFGFLKDTDTAIRCYKLAIDSDPDAAGTYFNLGNLMYQNYQYELSIQYYQKCISIKPDFPDARYNLSFVLLLMGDYVNGFKEYESRLKRGPFTGDCFSQPFWDGHPVLDQTVFVYSEQGFGDSIHFCRYVTMVSQRVGQLIFGCRKEQARLFKTLIGVDQIIVQGDPVPDFDFQSSLLSLPHLLKTDETSIPCSTPYVFPNLSEQPQELTSLIEQIPLHKKRIGIVWGGNPENKNDQIRSVPLDIMAQLFSIQDIQWFSFQKGPQAKDIKAYSKHVIDLSKFFKDFYDTACALCHMDLLITVDTAVAHLAGSLGIPFWILIPDQPDWRWLLNHSDNPWYPTGLIFRKARDENWNHVMERVNDHLSAVVLQKKIPVLETYFNDALQCLQQKDDINARVIFQKMLSLQPALWESELNLSALFFKSKHFFAAILYGKRACKRERNPAVSWQNLGVVFHHDGNIVQAIDCYQNAKKYAPEDPKINYELSKLLFQNGQWTEGLPLFEYRKFCTDLPKRRQYDIPYWKGASFKGKTLLIYSDFQTTGLIQYLRFVPHVKSYGGIVTLDMPASMYRLMAEFSGIDRIFYYDDIRDSESESTFDLQVSIQSLPHILGIEKSGIRQSTPYIKARKPYIPLVESIQKQNKQLNIGVSLSIEDEPISLFENIIKQIILTLNTNDIALFYIGFTPIHQYPFSFNNQLIDLSIYIDDYCDIANAVDQMDLVISMDNPVGHLAGAMYKKVLMILSHKINWYWSLDSDQSEWYPSMTVFKQAYSTEKTIQTDIVQILTEMLSLKNDYEKKEWHHSLKIQSESFLVHALGFFDGFTGFHVHTRSFFDALNQITPVMETELQLDSRLNNSVQYLQNTIIPQKIDMVNIAIRTIHGLHILSSCPGIKIGFVVFESNHIPYDWVPSLAYPDHLWTPSQWGKEILMKHGVVEDLITVIPEGVNSQVFHMNGPRIQQIENIPAFKFLHVGKFETRKGTKELIQAFDDTFKDNDQVRLILCSHTYTKDFHFNTFISQLRLKKPEKIIRVGPFAKNEDLADLYRSCDAFVMPTRAEGWGLPIIEAMACGLPVIVTGYSGLTEFANKNNAFLIDYKLETITRPFGLQIESKSTQYGEWAKPDMTHLKDLMQYVVANPEKAKERGQVASYDVCSKWTWNNAAKKALDAIKRLRK